MTEKPNCSTCPHFRTTHHGNECAESRTYLPLPAKALIEHVGCLSHPNAREYLMAPVIKELEEQPYNIMITRDEAIILIRDGVK